MKVLLVNGSPHKKGCTYTALCEVSEALNSAGFMLNQHYLSDFSLTEARILFDLSDLGCCTANALASRLNIDKSYMSRIIKRFEKKDW